MGVWLDDEFPEHPKIEALGDDLARWLYVAGLCYANRNLTGGRIPKGAALRLTDKASPKLIAKLLVAIPDEGPCWEDHGDHYRIHNYGARQQSAERRRAEKEAQKQRASEHARKAAEDRWARERAEREHGGEHQSSINRASIEHRLSIDRASPEHQAEHPPGMNRASPRAMPEHPDSLARASAGARLTRVAPRAPIPTPLTPNGSSSSNHLVAAPAETEEEELEISEACRLVAERRYQARPPGEVKNPTSWKARVADDVRTNASWEPMLRASLTPEEMAEAIEPTPARPGFDVPFTPDPPQTDEQRESSRLALAAAKATRRPPE
jgi:hypothetical protein